MSDSLQPSTHRILKSLSDQINRSSKVPIINAERNDVLWGTVVSIQPGPPQTLTISIIGSSTNVTNVSYLSSYIPTVNDYVMMSKFGTDLVALGAIGGTSAITGITLGHTFVLVGAIAASTSTTTAKFYVPVPPGQKVTMVGYTVSLEAGTCTVDFQDGGVNIAGASGISVTTTDLTVTTGINYPINANHKLSLNVTVPSGATTLVGTVHARYGS